MCIVWSGGLLGDQLVASTNTGCLCQLKTQSSRLLHTINSAHTVDGLPIIVARAALKGAGVFIKTSPCRCGCLPFMCCLTARRFLVWFFSSCVAAPHTGTAGIVDPPKPVTPIRNEPTMDVVSSRQSGFNSTSPSLHEPPLQVWCSTAAQANDPPPHPPPAAAQLMPSINIKLLSDMLVLMHL